MTAPHDWKALDKDLGRIDLIGRATSHATRPLVAPGLALAFLVVSGLGAAALVGAQPLTLAVVAAAVIGGYMAMAIGANDVANNMGPAVGARTMRLGTALIVAALCETAGALLAGGAVVDTVAHGIITPQSVAAPADFVRAMLAALLAGAIWINLATWLGAPVSTTHAIIGGVMGAGVAAAGMSAVTWPTMATIATGWVAAPVMAGAIAAALLAFVKTRIAHRDDVLGAARLWVPVLTGAMGGCFVAYLLIKGTSRLYPVELGTALGAGLAAGTLLWLVMRPVIRRQSRTMENRRKGLKALFAWPLIVSAAMLSFAHGANDVANAVGPLAAIVTTVTEGTATTRNVAVPAWVMLIGALGLSVGLMLFGPRLVRLVGSEITRLNAMRAYCVALAAAITVILASALGLPVSSTHVAIGGVFGVGFLREWLENRRRARGAARAQPVEVRARQRLVRRVHFVTILAAWAITVPAAALLSAGLFGLLRLSAP